MLFLHSRSERFLCAPEKKLRLMTFKMSFEEKKDVISMLMKVKRCEKRRGFMILNDVVTSVFTKSRFRRSSGAKTKSGSIGVLTEILSILLELLPKHRCKHSNKMFDAFRFCARMSHSRVHSPTQNEFVSKQTECSHLSVQLCQCFAWVSGFFYPKKMKFCWEIVLQGAGSLSQNNKKSFPALTDLIHKRDIKNSRRFISVLFES